MSASRGAKRKRPSPKKPKKKPRKRSSTRSASTHAPPAPIDRPLIVGSFCPWAVTEELVRHLSDVHLRNLMRDLLVAEAYRCGSDVSDVVVNFEVKAGDEGEDARTPAGVTSKTWLGDARTCWQLKAGNAGQPSKLRGEVTKPQAATTLKDGGRFVLIASGAVDGGKGMTSRRRALVADARRARLPTSRIEVITCEGLTSWINEHPALSAALRGIPPGYSSVGDWAALPMYRDPWVGSAKLDKQLDDVRRAVDFGNPKPAVHLHVFGRPGVGKTRFVLQACVDAPWCKSVLYVPQLADVNVTGMLAAVASAGVGRLVLVVDEVPPERVESLAYHAFAARDRLRIISIGPHASPDSHTIAQMEVEALDRPTMTKLIEVAHPTMPPEHVRYVVSFADGYTRLARMAANAIASHPDMHTADLLMHGDIKQLMDRMLGKDDRRPLHVVAVLSSVGWTGVRAVEGAAIAEHFELDWRDVQAQVQRFDDQFGIAPRANDLRYVSPAPLGIYLALDAVQSYPELVRSLPDKLPNEQARQAYNERLAAILMNPRAQAFGEEELALFFDWSHFVDANAVERWVTLSTANPVLAAGNALAALQDATDEQRRSIEDGARRRIVRGLVRLAAYRHAFHDAALALAELAAAENETWANNASAEFVGRYQMFLSATACPYIERLNVIDELLASGRPALESLAIRALMRAGNQSERRMVDDSPASGPRPVPWRPATGQEHLECILAALSRLQLAAALCVPDKVLIEAGKHLAVWLREPPVREQIADFMRAAIKHHPAIREQFRYEVDQIATNSRRFWNNRDEAAVAWIAALAAEFSDRTPGGRLREVVGHPDWERSAESLEALARELVAAPAVLWSEWPWLTSGDAIGAWDLGMALEKVDSEGALLSQLTATSNTGDDVRVIAGYARSRAMKMPASWIDDWLDALEADVSASTLLVFDLTRRLADTSRGAERIARMARADRLPPNAVANLAFGPWVLGPELPAVRALLEVLVQTPENHIHLLHMLDNRLQKHPQDIVALEDLTLSIVTERDLLLADSMSGYHWDKLARAVLPRHARAIARTIFAAQAKRDGVSFFLESSIVANTLDACIAASSADVWEELAPRLVDADEAEVFAIGFPSHVMDCMPRQAVLDWIAMDPDRRAAWIAEMTAKSISDSSLAAAVLDQWGGASRVKQRFFSAFISGGWSGDASAHWERLAAQLDSVATQSQIGGVRRWARYGARELRRMAEHDRRREIEERVRGYG